MKVNKILFPLAAVSMVFAACDDQVMEWKDPDKTVTGSEIPMELAEKISQYDYIKNYMAEYHPGVQLTLGMGLDNFLDDEEYRQVVLDNFQGVTFGNAMKHQSVVSAGGAFNWSKVDQFIAMNSNLPIHGHNLLWHTQQQQSYMKSLINPEMVISGNTEGGIINIITNSDFEDGTDTGWTGWSHYERKVVSPGHESNYALLCEMDDQTNVNYDCQLWWSFNLEVGKTYAYRFWVKSPDNIKVQFIGQNASYAGIYKTEFTAGKEWTLCEGEFEYTESDTEDICRIGLQFGGTPNSSLYVDDFEFGEKGESGPYNYCVNGDFSDGLEGWTLNSGNDETEVVEISDNPSGNKNVLKLVAPATAANAWDLEVVSPVMPTLEEGKTIRMSFYVKSDQPGKMRCAFDGLKNSYPWMPWIDPTGSWSEAFETSTSWTYINLEVFKYNDNGFAEGASEWDIKFDMGYVPGVTYYLDDVRVEEVTAEAASAPKRRATSISYKLKTPEEKKAILLDCMESWIKEAMEHVGEHCTSWDVINEPIGDNGQIRGIEGGWMEGDSEPTESEEAGLSLNWANDAGNGHFYWGYYCGWDYAVKAFEYAAKYNPNGAKLFVNEYNLETSPSKLAKLIEFVNYIDNHGAHVDGIGTQMHVSSSITKEQVDAMFKTLAATKKLIRITELDVALGTASPSLEQLQQQSDVYQMILTSFFENVPADQQSGITLWTLTDNAKEHEYWLKDESPNVFDAAFGRKIAYKGVCDAIAGFDIGSTFTSHDWSQSANQSTAE